MKIPKPMTVLNTVVVLELATGGDRGFAYVDSYCDSPTYSGRDEQGQRVSWRADMVRPATVVESAAYWQQRAELAEAKLKEQGH